MLCSPPRSKTKKRGDQKVGQDSTELSVIHNLSHTGEISLHCVQILILAIGIRVRKKSMPAGQIALDFRFHRIPEKSFV
ncbi:MAG: hypothetical protein M2R45_00022 [Verrucomicrobia subdivision 3 bacterium]|nr:hypothetical protein [Limisphaerales bacterium]MCS1412519.1 hypothetical protein [Limisphaerales bacterium]